MAREAAEAKSSRNLIDANTDDAPAEQAKVVIYAPGCQFKSYSLDLTSGSDVAVLFECHSLPTKSIHGFLAPSEIPSSMVATEKKLDIVGELEPDWVCDFFLTTQYKGAVIVADSCLGSSILLGGLASSILRRKAPSKSPSPISRMIQSSESWPTSFGQ